MSLYEVEHPLGRDIDTIHNALIIGAITDESELPRNMKINYEFPVAGQGVGTLRVADWETENQTAIYFPIVSDMDTWTLEFAHPEPYSVQVKQRVFIRDLLGRGFPVEIAEEQILSSFLRFDIFDDGIVMFSNNDGKLLPVVGKYEGETYDVLENMARVQSSIHALVDLASRF